MPTVTKLYSIDGGITNNHVDGYSVIDDGYKTLVGGYKTVIGGKKTLSTVTYPVSTGTVWPSRLRSSV